jgi:hypothetical protein
MRQVQTPSVLTDETVSSSLFLIAREIAPRAECAWQLVAFDKSSIIAPLGAHSIAIAVANLLLSRDLASRPLVLAVQSFLLVLFP